MRRDIRELTADWLMLLGAVALLVSLFLPWSHQRFPRTAILAGVPLDPTAWQVYSVLDVGLAGLVAALAAVAAIGGRVRRLLVLGAAAVALAFAVHARASPPTNGLAVPGAVIQPPRPGDGETVAIAGLGVAIAGLALSFTAD